jgi:hypothetical protein
MNRNDDFDQTLEAWLHREAPAQAPDRLLDSALQRVAAQSQKRGWLRRLIGENQMTILTRTAAVGAVVALAAFIGMQVGNMPNLGASPSPTASVPAEPSATASPDASPNVPTPSGDPSVASLVVRLQSGTDIGLNHVLTVVEDGRIITGVGGAGDSPFVQRRLTPEGVELLRQEVEATGLAGESADFELVPKPGVEPPGRGFVGHAMDVGLPGGETAIISWIAVADDEALYWQESPERETLDALAARLTTLDEWLPATAWDDETSVPYESARYRVLIENLEWGGSLDDLPVESSTVDWPLNGSIEAFGDPMAGQAGIDNTYRCGVITAAERDAVAAALESVDAPPGDATWPSYQLGIRSENRLVRITLAPIMPDETSCEGAAIPL